MRKENETVYSPIALDLGAQNTGVYMAHYDGDVIDTEGAVICLTNDKITWMQKDRTAKRHQRRSIKRKHLVRRLLWQILEDYFGIKYDSTPAEVSEFLNGLLRRRGFTYLSLDDVSDPNDFASLSPDPYVDLIPSLQNRAKDFLSLTDILNAMGEDVTMAKDILSSYNGTVKDAEKYFKEAVKNETLLGEAKEYTDGFKELLNTADSTVKALQGGHKARWDYLKNIRIDILNSDSILSQVYSHSKLDGERLSKLIGNLSNLQLRTLRRYFNDPIEKKGATYNDAKLKECLKRWLLSWHVSGADVIRRRNNVASLDEAPSAINWLCSINPNDTIPPFEGQDNRKHPTDNTILLDDEKLSLQFPMWRELADALIEGEKENFGGLLLEGLDEICALQDRKASKEYLTALTTKDEALIGSLKPFPLLEDKVRMYFIARVYDRSKAIDPYLCRDLIRFGLATMQECSSASPKADDAFNRLRMVLDGNPELIKTFFDLGARYYEDIALAKGGLWFDSQTTIFRTSGLNTPRKAKIKHILIGNLLGEVFKAEEWSSLEDSLGNAKIGRTGFWGALEYIEGVRKESGNVFGEEYSAAEKILAKERAASGGKKSKGKSSVDQSLQKVIYFVREASSIIAQELKHNDAQMKYYNNPFTLAQLYIHAKGDVAGFSNSCEAIAKENQWRSSLVDFGDNRVAHCSRMTSDSTRPFDGALARMLERQAQRIAEIKLDQIGPSIPENIDITIYLEENAFTFTEGLNQVKTGKSASGRLEKRLNRLEARQNGWETKDQRIKNASKGICPYTGRDLTDNNGELDHIIPRSLTKKLSGTVFNHEANLIYCSNEGNIKKGCNVWGLENLKAPYLLSQYGTDNFEAIKGQIRSTVLALANRRDVSYQALSDDEQRDVRHALFMYTDKEVFNAALDFIKMQIKTRVNGTQAYLAKKTCEILLAEIKKRNPNTSAKFNTIKVSAEVVSDLRRRLAFFAPQWNKVKPQPSASHVRDAMLALVCGESNDSRVISVSGKELDADTIEYAKFLEGLFPDSISILQQTRKDSCVLPNVSKRAIFKDSLYQEHFVPVWSHNGDIKVGFRPKELVSIKKKDKEPFFKAVRQFVSVSKDGAVIADNFEDFINIPGCWPIDKQKAIAWLFNYEKMPNEEDTAIYGYLEGLRYTTAKKNVISALMPKNKVDYSAIGSALEKLKKKISFAEGDVTLTIGEPWLKVVDFIKSKGIINDCSDEELVNKVVCEFFNATPKKSKSRMHQRVRKVYSMPLVAQPSGGVRLRRKDWRGNYVYQLAANDYPNIGFAVKSSGSVDFNNNARHPAFAKSSGIGYLGGEKTLQKDAEVVCMNVWRRITVPDKMRDAVIALELSPNSCDRMRVRCEVKWEFLKKAYGEVKLDIPATAFDQGAELPGELAEKCTLWKARSKLFVEKITATSVVFSYIVQSTSSEMKVLFNEGSPLN